METEPTHNDSEQGLLVKIVNSSRVIYNPDPDVQVDVGDSKLELMRKWLLCLTNRTV